MNSDSPISEPDRLDRNEIKRLQLERLKALLGEVADANPFWSKTFASAGVDIATIGSLADLGRLPLVTKSDLAADQTAHAPYGSNLTYEMSQYSRLHQTSGTTGTPARWLDTPASWDWIMQCWAQIYRIVGLNRHDVLAFPFSFGPYFGFWAAFDGAARLGNLCLAGGGMSSSARLRMIDENKATIVSCTPTYALRLAEVAAEEGIDLKSGSVRSLIVAGEPGGSIASTRQRIESAWGARVFDHWGMTELGSPAIECVENPGGMHVLETECIAEIIEPSGTEPVDTGEVGELVITNLGRLGSPLIRYRTGDLVQADDQPCSCGRHLLRLKGGILGRSDDMFTIRGNNVFPSSIEAILREHDDVAEYRIVVTSRRSMQHLKIEVEPRSGCAPNELVDALAGTVKDRLNFQAEVVAVAANSLPRFELKGRRFFREEG